MTTAAAEHEHEQLLSNLMLGLIAFCILFGMCLAISLQHCWQRHFGSPRRSSQKCKDTGVLCELSDDEDEDNSASTGSAGSASGLTESVGSATRHKRKQNARQHFSALLEQITLAYPCTMFQHDCEDDRGIRAHRAHFSQSCEGLSRLSHDLVPQEICKFCRKRSIKLIYEQMLPHLEKELQR